MSDNGLSLSVSVAVNGQILEVILTLGDVILMAYHPIIIPYVHDCTFRHMNHGLTKLSDIARLIYKRIKLSGNTRLCA